MRWLWLCASVALAQPGVHSVKVEGDFVVIRSAGIGLDYLGPIQEPPGEHPAPRQFEFRIPRKPEPGKTRVPPDVVGVFLNGAPMWNGAKGEFRAGLQEGQLVGWALDGYPVYYSANKTGLDEFQGRTNAAGKYGYYDVPRSYFRGKCCAVGPLTQLDWQLPEGMKLQTVHERAMHLILISEDLNDFVHLHPEPDAGWVYRARYGFPRGGKYQVFRDYTPEGGKRRVDATWMALGEPKDAPKAAVENWPVRVQAGEETLIGIEAPAGLEPWLGAWAHFFVLGEDGTGFAHLHAEDSGRVEVSTNFAKPGAYRVWGQYQVNGVVQTRAWRVVVEGARPRRQTVIPAGAIPVRVSADGFSPTEIRVPAGGTLAVTRDLGANCGRELVVPDLGLRVVLTAGETTLVPLPKNVGSFRFVCGMGMYRGSLVLVGPPPGER